MRGESLRGYGIGHPPDPPDQARREEARPFARGSPGAVPVDGAADASPVRRAEQALRGHHRAARGSQHDCDRGDRGGDFAAAGATAAMSAATAVAESVLVVDDEPDIV